jgi:hypothetical protein
MARLAMTQLSEGGLLGSRPLNCCPYADGSPKLKPWAERTKPPFGGLRPMLSTPR